MLRILVHSFVLMTAAQSAPRLVDEQRALVGAASALLDEAQISYVYGGYQIGDGTECKQCNDCLTQKAPSPKQRLVACPICKRCSIDCSHFTELVYRQAGMPYPYLDTATMLRLSAATLQRNYHLVDLGTDASAVQPGDLLVYDGHVVMVERVHRTDAAMLADGLARYRGDVVHATGGKDIRRPGEGIQRERFVDLETFRGPLRRILRHVALSGAAEVRPAPAPVPARPPAQRATAPARRLRPVEKRKPNGD